MVEYETNSFIPTRRFVDELSERTSARTVRRSLRTPAKKSFVPQRHKEERLRFPGNIWTLRIVNMWGWICAQGPDELSFIST